MKKILIIIGIILLSSCTTLKSQNNSFSENDSLSEKTESTEWNLESLSEKEKIWKLLKIYWIWLEKFDVEVFYDDFLTIKYSADDWITNRIYSESWTEIRIKKIVENIYEINAHKEFDNYLSSVWDIKNMKQIYEIPGYDWVSWNSFKSILYTNKFVYDLDKWEIIGSEERINTYLTHTFEINQNKEIIIRDISDGKKYMLKWDIWIDDMWNYFIVKDWYIALLSKNSDKVFYGKITDNENIVLKSYNLEYEELDCGGWWSIEMYQWYIYIKNWKIVTKWSCPMFLNHTIFNLEDEILEENNKWSIEWVYNNFWEFYLY